MSINNRTNKDIYIEVGETEIHIEVDFNYTPADPGRYHGRPEDCYPSEPAEVEINRITMLPDNDDGEFVNISVLLENKGIAEEIEARIFELLEDEDE